jgi:hypothetical protein
MRIEWAIVVTIASRFVVIATGIVTSIMTARFLLPAGRGEYFLVLTTAQMLAQVCNLGLASSNTYFVAKDRRLFSALFSNTAWISFIGVPLAAAVILGLWSLASGAVVPPGYAWFAIALAPLIMFNLLGANLFVGLEQVGTFNVIQVAGAAVLLPLMITAGMMGAGPRGFLTASVTGWAIVGALVWWLLAKQSSGSLGFRRDVFVSSFKYSTRAYLATMAGFMVLRMNVFTLNAVVGPEQVGYYSVASQIADTLSALPQAIALVLFPKLVASQVDRFKTTMHKHGANGRPDDGRVRDDVGDRRPGDPLRLRARLRPGGGRAARDAARRSSARRDGDRIAVPRGRWIPDLGGGLLDSGHGARRRPWPHADRPLRRRWRRPDALDHLRSTAGRSGRAVLAHGSSQLSRI